MPTRHPPPHFRQHASGVAPVRSRGIARIELSQKFM
jgi:hypothetical protein